MFSPFAITFIAKAPIRANVGPTLILFVTEAICLGKTKCFLLLAYKYEARERALWEGYAVLVQLSIVCVVF